MRILDLRPRSVRYISSLWETGSHSRGKLPEVPRSPNALERLAARIVDGVTSRRIAGRITREPGPVIVSVGNLALGGTGKTPVVGALAMDLASAGWKGAVLTRGFGSPLAGPLTVDPDNILAGDEARLIAKVLDAKGWPVVQSRHRPAGLDHLLDEYLELDVVIVEDGHQTAGLGRHLDIVILDSWTVTDAGDSGVVSPHTGPVFPLGPWRESSGGAARAGIWLLETDEDMPASGEGGQVVTTFRRTLTLHDPVDPGATRDRGSRPAVLSGIARPEAFEKSLQSVMDTEPVLAVRCGDHAEYGPRTVEAVLEAMVESRADHLVTTGKDWVKLAPFWPRGKPVLVTDLQIEWGSKKTLPDLVGERLQALRHR